MSSSGFQNRGFGPHGTRYSGPSSSGGNNDASRSTNHSYSRSYDSHRRIDRQSNEVWTNPPFFQYNPQVWQNSSNNNNNNGRSTGRFRGNSQPFRGNYRERGNGRSSYARSGGFRFSNGRGNAPFNWRYPNDKQEEPSPPLLGSEEERRQKITDAVDELKRKLLCNDGSTCEDVNLWDDDSIPAGETENRDTVKGIPELKHGPPELDLTPNDLKDIGRVHTESVKAPECDNDVCEIINEEKTVKVFSEITINDSRDELNSEINSNSLISDCDKEEKISKIDNLSNFSKSKESEILNNDKISASEREKNAKEKALKINEKLKRLEKGKSTNSYKKSSESQLLRSINPDSFDILKKDENSQSLSDKKSKLRAWSTAASPDVLASPTSPNFSRESGKIRFTQGLSQSFTPPLLNPNEILQPPPAFDPRPRNEEVQLSPMIPEPWMYNQMPPISMMPPMNLPMDYGIPGYVQPMAPFAPMPYPPVLDYGPPPPMVQSPLDRLPSPFTDPLDSGQPGENEALSELRKAMEFAEKIMGMTGNQDTNEATDHLDDFPTLPDLPPITADVPLPVPPPQPEKSTKKSSKRREKKETASKSSEINAIDIPIPGESPRTPPYSPQDEARRKVAFNLTPKSRKIDTTIWTSGTYVNSSKSEIPYSGEHSELPSASHRTNAPMDITDFMKTVKFDDFHHSPSIPEKSYTPDLVQSPSLLPDPQKQATSSWKDRVIGRFLKMSKNDIQNMINHSNLRKFDIAMQHLVKEKKSSLSLEMRNTEDERIKNSNNSYDKDDFIHQLKAILDPAATVDISDLPTNFIHQLSEVLQLDVVPNDKEKFNESEQYKFMPESTSEIDQMQLNESSQNIETNAPAITSDMAKSHKIDNRTTKDTTKNTVTVVDKPIQNIRKRNKIDDNKIHSNSSSLQLSNSDNQDTLIMDELDDIFTTGIRTKTMNNNKLTNSRFNIPTYELNNQRIETPIVERVDSIFNAGLAKAKGTMLKSPLITDDKRISRGRKNSSDYDVFRNLTKEEYDAKYGESSHSSYDNPYRIMNPKHSRKHGDHQLNGENYGIDDSGSKHDQITKSRFSRSPSRHSHNTLEESGDDDDDIDSSDYDSETSTTGSSSDDSSDEPSIDVSRMLRFIKEREKIAKKKSINEEIRDEVTAEIERKRREKKAHKEHKRLKKKDKRKRDKKGKKRKNRKKKKRRSHHSDNEHEERSNTLNEREIKKENENNEEIHVPPVRKKIIGPKSVMAKAALLEKEEQILKSTKSTHVNTKSPSSPAKSPNNSSQFLKTKAQLKQMPDAVKKNPAPIVQVSKHISEISIPKYSDSFRRNERIGSSTPPLTSEQASEFLKKSAERVETLMLPRQFKIVSESKNNHEKVDVIASPGQLSVRQDLMSPYNVNNLIKTVSVQQDLVTQSKSPVEDEVKKFPKKLDLKSYKERTLLNKLKAEGKLPGQETPKPITTDIILKNSNFTSNENSELKKVPIKELKAPVVSLKDFRIVSRSEINAQSSNFDVKSSPIDKFPRTDELKRNHSEKSTKNFDNPRKSSPKDSVPGPKCIKRRKMSADVPGREFEISARIPDKKVENLIENNKLTSQVSSEWNHHFRFDNNVISDCLPDTVPVETISESRNEELISENIDLDICDENSAVKLDETDDNEELPKLDPEMVKKSLLNAEESPLNPEETSLIPEANKTLKSLELIEELPDSSEIVSDEPNILHADSLDLEKPDSSTIAPLPDDVGPSEASEALLVDAKSPDQPESTESFLPTTLRSSVSRENIEETFSREISTPQEVEKLSDIYSASGKLQESIIDKEPDDLASFKEDEAKWRTESDHNDVDQKDEVSFPESHSTNWQLETERKNVVLHDRALVVDTPRNSLLDDPIAFATSNNSPTNEAADEYGMLCGNDDIPGSIYENQLVENSPIDIDDVPIRVSFTPDTEIPVEINEDNHVKIPDKDLMEVTKNTSPDRVPSPILQDPDTSILDDSEGISKVSQQKVDEEIKTKREDVEKKAEEDCHPPELEEAHEKIEENDSTCEFRKGDDEEEVPEEREMPRLTVADEKKEENKNSHVLKDPLAEELVEKDIQMSKPEEKRTEEPKDKELSDKSKDRHSKKHKTADPLKKLNKSSIPKEHKKQKHHHDKKKSKITEAKVQEAIKTNIVTEIEKPTTKNAVMARMREIDIAIQNLMNEKMTLYQMLQTDEWPIAQTEPEEIIEQKTKKDKKKAENKVKEIIETVPAKSVPSEIPKSSKTTKVEEKRPPSWEDKVPHKSTKKRAHSKEPDSTKSKESRKEEPEIPKTDANRKDKKNSSKNEDTKKPVKLSQLLARDFKPKPSNLRKKSISPNVEDKKNSKNKSITDDLEKTEISETTSRSEEKKNKKNTHPDDNQTLLYSDDSTLDSIDRSNDQKRATGLALLEESMKREAIAKRMKDSSKRSKESTPDEEDIDISKINNSKKKNQQKKVNNKKSESSGGKTKKHVQEVIDAVAKNRVNDLYKGDGSKKTEKPGKLAEVQRRRSLAEEIDDLFATEAKIPPKNLKKLETKVQSVKNDREDDADGKKVKLEMLETGTDKDEDVKLSKDVEKEKKVKKEKNEDGRSSSSVRNEILQDWSDSSSNSSVESKFKHRKTSNASAAVIEDSENEERKQKPKLNDSKSSKPQKSGTERGKKEFEKKSRESEKSKPKPKLNHEKSRGALKTRDDESPIEGDDEDEELSFRKRGRSKKSKKLSSRRSNKSSSRSRSRSKRIITSSSRDSSPEIERPKKRPRSGSSTSSINSRKRSLAHADNHKTRKTQNITRIREEMMNCRVNLVDCKYLLDLSPDLQSQALKKLGVTRINSWTTPKCVVLSDKKSGSEDDSMIVIEADENIGSSSVIELVESGLDLEEDNVSEKSTCLGFPPSPRVEELAKSSISDVHLIDEGKDDAEEIDIKEEPISIDNELPKLSKSDEQNGAKDAHEDDDDKHEDNNDRKRYTVHKGPILDIKVFGDSFLAASEDGAIYRYSQKSNGILNIYQGHEAAVTCLYVHEIPGIAESKKWYLFSGSLDATLRCYDVIGGTLNRPVVTIGSPIQCMDQAWGSIFIGTKSGHISRYDIKSASLREDKLDFSDKPVLALRASTEGPRKVLIVASRNQPITIRDAQNGLFLRTISGQRTHTVYSLMKDRDLVYCGTSSTSIPVFDFINGEQVSQYTAGVGIVCMRLYRQLLFAGCYDGNIYVFDTKEPKLICSIPGPGNMLLSMEIVDNTIIAGSKDKRLHAWSMPPQVRAILHDRT